MAKKYNSSSDFDSGIKALKQAKKEFEKKKLIELGEEVLSRFGEGKDVQITKHKKVTAEDALRYFRSGKVKLSAVNTTDPLNRGL